MREDMSLQDNKNVILLQKNHPYSKPLQGMLFYRHRNTIMGIRVEDFAKYKELYIEVLKKYDLYDHEEDLMDI